MEPLGVTPHWRRYVTWDGFWEFTTLPETSSSFSLFCSYGSRSDLSASCSCHPTCILLPCSPPPAVIHSLSGTASPNKFSLPKVAFYHSNRKNDHYNTHLSLIASWELFHILKFIFIFMYMYLSVCHMCVDASGDQKRVSDFLGLELQVIVSHLAWVLGTELESSGRTACNFKKSFIFWDYNYIILCFLFLPEDPCTEPSLLSFKLMVFLFIVIAYICC